MTANPYRGETSFAVDGQDLLLRPTFASLVAVEDEIGSLFALVERASEGSLTIAEMSAILWHCAPEETRPDRDRFGSAILSCGLIEATKPVRAILAQVLQGQA